MQQNSLKQLEPITRTYGINYRENSEKCHEEERTTGLWYPRWEYRFFQQVGSYTQHTFYSSVCRIGWLRYLARKYQCLGKGRSCTLANRSSSEAAENSRQSEEHSRITKEENGEGSAASDEEGAKQNRSETFQTQAGSSCPSASGRGLGQRPTRQALVWTGVYFQNTNTLLDLNVFIEPSRTPGFSC